MGKVFIFGIDGGSFEIIKKLISDGRLPTFQRLMQNGTRGVMRSTLPPHTAPGWVSAATGVGPGTHGVYQFWDTQGSSYVGKFMGSKDWGAEPLWKILNEAGLKTGIINVPMTHPPYPLDGYIITWPLSNTLRYSYPDNLLSEIAVHGGHYLPDVSTMYHGEGDYLEKALKITQKRTQTIQYLVNAHEWDLMMAVFPEVDRICHFYWHFWDEQSVEYRHGATSEERQAITRIYEATDQALAAILSSLPDDTLVLIISDHGFGPGELNFNVQTFLQDKGFLSTRPVDFLSATEAAKVEAGSGNWFSYEEHGKRYTVDWSKTRVYMAAPGSYGVNINLKGRQEQGIVEMVEFEHVRTQVIKELMMVKHPTTGDFLFQNVLRSEEVYQGERQKKAPDLLLIPRSFGVMVNHNLVPGQWFSSPAQKGMHRQEGIILAAGPGVKPGHVLETAKLEDILPTVLHHFGLSIPQYAEGKVLPIYDELVPFTESSAGAVVRPEMESSYSKEEQAEIEERLKALGYL